MMFKIFWISVLVGRGCVFLMRRKFFAVLLVMTTMLFLKFVDFKLSVICNGR